MDGIGTAIFTGEVVFSQEAARFFNFPINNTIRLSLWEEANGYSTPSELTFNESVNIGRPTMAKCEFIKHGYYSNVEVAKDTIYRVGTFPLDYGLVKVIDVIRY